VREVNTNKKNEQDYGVKGQVPDLAASSSLHGFPDHPRISGYARSIGAKVLGFQVARTTERRST
jgi:hypothetical protein